MNDIDELEKRVEELRDKWFAARDAKDYDGMTAIGKDFLGIINCYFVALLDGQESIEFDYDDREIQDLIELEMVETTEMESKECLQVLEIYDSSFTYSKEDSSDGNSQVGDGTEITVYEVRLCTFEGIFELGYGPYIGEGKYEDEPDHESKRFEVSYPLQQTIIEYSISLAKAIRLQLEKEKEIKK